MAAHLRGGVLRSGGAVAAPGRAAFCNTRPICPSASPLRPLPLARAASRPRAEARGGAPRPRHQGDPISSSKSSSSSGAAAPASGGAEAARGPGVGGGGRDSPLPGQAETVFGGGGAAAAADEGLLALLTPGNASRSVADLDYLTELLAIQANDGPKSIALFGSRNMGLTHQQLVEVLACALVAAGNRIFTSGATGTNAAVIKGALRAIEGDGKGGFGNSSGSGGGGGGGSGSSALDAALAGLGATDADAAAAAAAAGAAPASPPSSSSDDDNDDDKAPTSAVASGRRLPSSAPLPGSGAGDDDRLTVILPQSLERQPPESRELLARVGRVVEMPGNDTLALMDASRICNREIIGSVQQVVCFAFRDSRLLLETCAEAKDAKKIVTLFYLD